MNDAADPASVPLATPALQERELKLFVPASSIAAIWTHPTIVAQAIGPLTIARLANRYFDTADEALASRRMALRLRRSGRRWVQTLKTGGARDGAMSVRGEWEMPVDGPRLVLSRFAATPLAAIGSMRSLARRLVPVFSVDFRRESRVLLLSDGSEVEVAFDRGLVVTGRGRTRRTADICELEIELKRAGRDDPAVTLLRFARRLARDIPLIPLATSKAARGYRLRHGVEATPVKVSLPSPSSDDRARPHLARVLESCNAALLANGLALLQASPGSASQPDDAVEFIHQARVAIRRMRSALSTFGQAVSGRRVDAVDTALQALGHVFGAARDWDVLAESTWSRLSERIGDDAEGRNALSALRAEVDTRRPDLQTALLRELDGGAFGATTLAVQRLVVRLENDASGPSVTDVATRRLARLFDRVVAQARRIAELDLEARHALRVEVKRLRYALDLFASLLDAAALDDFVEALADLQDRLGRLNDAAVTDQLLRSLAPSAARDLVVARYGSWFERHVKKQLPKVGAESIALELMPKPWTMRSATLTIVDQPGSAAIPAPS